MSNNNNQNQQRPPQPDTPKDTAPTKKWKPGLYEGEDEGSLESDLEKELAAAGLKRKFIDYKQAKTNGNRSRSGWIIYTGLEGNKEPVRRGTLVLAVKNDANYKKQKMRIELQRKVMNRYNQTKAEELNKEAQSLGGTSRIISGYNENG